MTTKRHNIRYTPGQNRHYFPSQADKDADLARLDDLIASCNRPKEIHFDRHVLKIAKSRRRKMSGWVVGC